MNTKLELLRRMPLFSLFKDDATLEAFVNESNFSKLASGGVVFRIGDAAHKVYVVVSGKIRLSRNNKVLATLGPGEIFGEVGPFLEIERTATAVSVGDSILFEFEKTLLEHAPLDIRYELLKHLYVVSLKRFVETTRKCTLG